MSSLKPRDRAIIEMVLDMEDGYVLNLSSSDFKNLILIEAGIDVYTDDKYVVYSSKAKKLRRLFDIETDDIVGKIILALLGKREEREEKRKLNIYGDYVDKYEKEASYIKKIASEMCTGDLTYRSEEERLNADILTARKVLNDLQIIATYLCNNHLYNENSQENDINDYFRDMLKQKHYVVNDQSRHGHSATGKDAGEVDILLTEPDRPEKEEAIVEGLILKSIYKNYIVKHIKKAVVSYNPHGTPTFILIYCGASDFQRFWNGIIEYLKRYNYPFEVKSELSEDVGISAAIKTAHMILCKDGFDFPLYFMAVRMRNK